MRMFNRLKPYFYDLSKNNFGCRVVQKIIEFSQSNEEVENFLINNLFENMKSLIFDTNGNYVIFKMLEVYSSEKMNPLISRVEESVSYKLYNNYEQFAYMCT